MSNKQPSSLLSPCKNQFPKNLPIDNIKLKPSQLIEDSGITQDEGSSTIENSTDVSKINNRVYNDLNSSAAMNDFQRQEIPDNNEDIFRAPQRTARLQKNLPSIYVLNSEETLKSSDELKASNGQSNTIASTTQNNSNKEKFTRKRNSCTINRFCVIKYSLIITLIILLFLFIKWKADF